MDYIIVSAATEDSRYVDCLKVQKSLYAHHGYLGVAVPDQGSWEENTKIKPHAIRLAFKVSPVVLWIDADCKVDPPEAIPEGNWDVCTLHNIHPHHKIKISAGFLLLRNTPATQQFLTLWDNLNCQYKKDHPAMVQALKLMRSSLTVVDMSGWLRGRHTINAFAPERGVFAG